MGGPVEGGGTLTVLGIDTLEITACQNGQADLLLAPRGCPDQNREAPLAPVGEARGPSKRRKETCSRRIPSGGCPQGIWRGGLLLRPFRGN